MQVMNYKFSVIVDVNPEDDDRFLDVADALGEAECLDASLGGHDEGIEAIFEREATSLDEAIRSAIVAIEGAGYRVIRVEMPRESIMAEI